jgi:HK97 family phage major capsid protein
MSYEEQLSPAERDLQDLKRNSNTIVNLMSAQVRREEAANPRIPPSGYKHGGEFLAAVHRQIVHRVNDPRLVMTNAVGTYSTEINGPSVGFAMPNDHSAEVLTPVVGSGSLLSAFDPVPASTGLATVAVDETSEWSTSGVTADIVREGGTITASKGVLRKVNVFLHKIPALVHVSEELIQDSPAYQRYVWRAMGRKIRNRVEAQIIQGSGADAPLGLLNSPALLTVSKEGSQASSTIVAANVQKMIARLLPGSFGSSLWILHSTALPQVAALGVTLYNPDAETPYGYGKLLGRPIVISEQANLLGQVGDLILCDPLCYQYALKGPATASTVEFAFDQDLASFRASVRMGGVPLLSAPVARRTGSDTLSCCVVLEAR